jgi:hypothetical protein
MIVIPTKPPIQLNGRAAHSAAVGMCAPFHSATRVSRRLIAPPASSSAASAANATREAAATNQNT